MVRGWGIFDVGVVKGWEWGEGYCGDGVEVGVGVAMGWEWGLL